MSDECECCSVAATYESNCYLCMGEWCLLLVLSIFCTKVDKKIIKALKIWIEAEKFKEFIYRHCIIIFCIRRHFLWGTYFIGCPGLSVRPVEMVPDVPPLDLQRVRGRPGPSEGAGHLHILTPLSSHVMGHLCEHGWKDTERHVVNGRRLGKCCERKDQTISFALKAWKLFQQLLYNIWEDSQH